jgi:hypothetical protein
MPNRTLVFCSWLCLLLTAAAQDAGRALRFAGTWQAKFKGQVFCTIKLEGRDRITGTLSVGHIAVNDDGDLTEAEPSPSGDAMPIVKSSIEGVKLSFEVDDGGEVMKLEIEVLSPGKAELRFVDPSPKIKPIAIERLRTE